MAKPGCSSKGKQDQRLQVAHGQVHTYMVFVHAHTHTYAHTGRGGECWQKLNVFARSGGEGKKGSRGAETNARWLLLVELWSGMEGRGNVFIPFSHPPHHHLHTSIPIPPTLLPHYLHSRKAADERDNPPSGGTSPSKLTRTHSDGCLIVRDTGRVPFSFKSKTDCFSLGRGLLDKQRWQSRDSAALWGVEDGGGGELVDSVRTRFSMFLFCARPSHKEIMFVSMCCKCAHVWATTENVWPRSSDWSRRDRWIFVSTSHHNFLPLFITCSHPPQLLSWPLLLYPSSTSPSVSLSWPSFLFLPLKPMLHLCAVTFEQKLLRTSQKRH